MIAIKTKQNLLLDTKRKEQRIQVWGDTPVNCLSLFFVSQAKYLWLFQECLSILVLLLLIFLYYSIYKCVCLFWKRYLIISEVFSTFCLFNLIFYFHWPTLQVKFVFHCFWKSKKKVLRRNEIRQHFNRLLRQTEQRKRDKFLKDIRIEWLYSTKIPKWNILPNQILTCREHYIPLL